MGGVWLHRLSHVNAKRQTAVCSVCGPVEIKRRSSNNWRCAIADKLRKWRIPAEEFFALLALQKNRCAICRIRFSATHLITIDHNHTTGELRGLLCGSCNSGIGHLGDSVAILESALDYLESPPYDDL